MNYRKQENVIFADFRKCRDALCDGPDDPWTLIAMTGGCFGGLLLWIAIIYGLNGLFA